MAEEYRTIHLTQGQVVIVDASDFEWLSQWKWFAHRTSWGGFYASRSERIGIGRQYTLKMHRHILGLRPGDMVEGDHINGNTLDNRRANLRKATKEQNMQNKKRHHNAGSGFKCVSRIGNRWRAYIRENGRRKHLGCFSTPNLAHDAYVRAAIEAFAEFSRAS